MVVVIAVAATRLLDTICEGPFFLKQGAVLPADVFSLREHITFTISRHVLWRLLVCQ
jgi:hypothetical protein